MINHVVDGVDKIEYFTADRDGHLLGQITTRHSCRGMRNSSHLQREIGGHRVHRIREILPSAIDTQHIRTTTELTLRTDLSGHTRDFSGEGAQTFHHVIDGVLQIEEFAAHFHVDGFAEIATCDSCINCGDGAHLRRKV